MATDAEQVDCDDFIPIRDCLDARTLWKAGEEIRARVALFEQLEATGHLSRIFEWLWTRSGLALGLDRLRELEASPDPATELIQEASALREGIRAATRVVASLDLYRRFVDRVLEVSGMPWPWLTAEILTRQFVLATEAKMMRQGWAVAYRARQPDPAPDVLQQMAANWERAAPRPEPPDVAIRRAAEAAEAHQALLAAGWLPEGRRTTAFRKAMIERKVRMLCRERLEGKSIHWIADTMAKGDRTAVRRWISDAEALLRGPGIIGDTVTP